MVVPDVEPPTGWHQLPVATRNAQCRDVFNEQGKKPAWFPRACRVGCYRGGACKRHSAYAISKSRIGGDQNRKRQTAVVSDLPVAKRQRADPNMRSSSSSSKSQKPAPAAISQQKQTPKEQVEPRSGRSQSLSLSHGSSPGSILGDILEDVFREGDKKCKYAFLHGDRSSMGNKTVDDLVKEIETATDPWRCIIRVKLENLSNTYRSQKKYPILRWWYTEEGKRVPIEIELGDRKGTAIVDIYPLHPNWVDGSSEAVQKHMLLNTKHSPAMEQHFGVVGGQGGHFVPNIFGTRKN